jgi:DNA-directed RNA polymerase alpha subunit
MFNRGLFIVDGVDDTPSRRPLQLRSLRESKKALSRNFDDRLEGFDEERWEHCCREMQIEIVKGDVHGAHKALDRYLSADVRLVATIHSEISTVFDAQVSGALYRAGLYRIIDVLNRSEEYLLTVFGLGETRAKFVIETCRKIVAGEVYER